MITDESGYTSGFETYPSPQTHLDVDALAQEIRRVDGSHSLGAGTLAEALMPFLLRNPAPQPKVSPSTDDKIDAWHDGHSSETLRDHLGMSEEVYRQFVDGQPPQEHLVWDIVPPHCTGTSFVFEPGVLHVRKDGSGYIAVNEEDFTLEDDRDGEGGSVHWITRMDASEIIALRDFLNGNTTADRLADKIEDLIAEFGDDPKAALECVSEHLLRRHARVVSQEVIDV